MKRLVAAFAARALILLFGDVRSELRALRRSPGFTLSSVLLLAIGIGANAAVYSLLNAALLRPLPFRAPEQLVTVDNVDLPYDFGGRRYKPRAYLSDLNQLTIFDGVSAHAVGALNFGGEGGSLRVSIAYVTVDFFRTLGRFPFMGRGFRAEDGSSGGNPHVAVLSHRIWQQEFGGARSAIGRPVVLNERQYRVIGVMPPEFNYPSNPDIWLPIAVPITNNEIFDAFKLYVPLTVIGRLRPGVSVGAANQAVARLERAYPTWSFVDDSGAQRIVRPLRVSLVGGSTRHALSVLMVAAAFVLGVACVNLAGLFSVRAVARYHDLSIRWLLGASSARLLQQTLTEAILLGLMGTACALLVAKFGMSVLGSLLPRDLSAVSPPSLDARVTCFAAAAAILSVAAVGLFSSGGIWASRAPRESANAGRVVKTRTGVPAREILTTAQLALALALLVVAGATLDSFRRIRSVDPGLDINGIAVAKLSLPKTVYAQPIAIWQFYRSTLMALAADPGIQSASVVDALPLAHDDALGSVLTIAAKPDSVLPLTYYVMPGYFATLGISLRRGRDFRWGDDPGNGILLNTTAARRLWGNEDVVGRYVFVGGVSRAVIGVVADVRTKSLGDTAAAQAYLPFAAAPSNTAHIVVRGETPSVAARLRAAVASVDARQLVYGIRTMGDVVADSLAARRTRTLLLVVFGLLALTLATVGVWASVAYGVNTRAREFSIRLALGCEPLDLFLAIIERTALVGTVGILIGAITAAALVRFVSSQIYDTSLINLRVITGASGILLGSAVLGGLVPALRVLRADPVDALRAD